MLSHTFKEELKKNNILSNKSNKFSKLFFKSFNGSKNISLYGGDYLSYGYIYIEVEDAVALKFYYKDIMISCLTGDKNTFVPIAFENGSNLTILGEGNNLKILIFGSKCRNHSKNYLIPVLNLCVKDCGKSKILSYNSKDDIVNNNLTEIKNYDNLYSIQVINEQCCGHLYKTDNVYYCTSKDNYASNILIENDIVDGVVVPTVNKNLDIVAYIKKGELYYKKIENNMASEEIKINRIGNARPVEFIPIEVCSGDISVLGVIMNNKTVSLYLYLNNEFVKKFAFKGEKCKLVLNGNSMEIIKFDDYVVTSFWCSIIDDAIYEDHNKLGINKVNINDVVIIDNAYLYFNDENCTEVNID